MNYKYLGTIMSQWSHHCRCHSRDIVYRYSPIDVSSLLMRHRCAGNPLCRGIISSARICCARTYVAHKSAFSISSELKCTYDATCHATPRHAMPYYAIPFRAVQYYTMPCHTIGASCRLARFYMKFYTKEVALCNRGVFLTALFRHIERLLRVRVTMRDNINSRCVYDTERIDGPMLTFAKLDLSSSKSRSFVIYSTVIHQVIFISSQSARKRDTRDCFLLAFRQQARFTVSV